MQSCTILPELFDFHIISFTFNNVNAHVNAHTLALISLFNDFLTSMVLNIVLEAPCQNTQLKNCSNKIIYIT